MSHFAVCVFSIGEGNHQNIDQIIAPYGIEGDNHFDWWTIGGRFSGLLGGEDSIRVGRLYFRDLGSIPENQLKEDHPEIWKEYKDLIDGKSYLASFVAKSFYPTFKGYLEEEYIPAPESFVDEKGIWHQKGGPGYRKQFWETVKRLQESGQDYWITVIDCHL